MLINLTGDKGLFLYDVAPRSLKSKFMQVFKANPKAVLGLTKAHFVIHSIKVLEKYDMAGLIVPFIGLSMAMNILPGYLVWAVFIGSSWYLVSSVSKKSKAANQIQTKKGGKSEHAQSNCSYGESWRRS
jgi:hypothetical protein